MDRADIRNNVRLTTVIEDTNVSNTEIDLLITQGMNEVSVASDWPFLYKTATITLVADQKNYPLPADFLHGYSLVDDDNDTNVPYIAPATLFEITGNNTGNTGTTARFFTIQGTDIWISPTPSAADTNRYTLYYYRDITALTDDAHIPEFNVAFHWMLVEYCKWKLYDREEYYDQSERARIIYATYLSDMITWYKSQFRRWPLLWGDGVSNRQGDPNLPFLFRI